MMKHFFILLMALAIHSSPLSQTSFITTWKTDNPGISKDNQIIIPTIGFGYYYEVNWGDGVVEKGITGDAIHQYAEPGTYSVSITGQFPAIYFNSAGDREKILSVDQWGDISWRSMAHAFSGCKNLRVLANDAPELKQVRDMSGMFQGAKSFNQPIGHWDVQHVTNMSKMFKGASLFNQDIERWNVSRVIQMSGLFWGASAFNKALNSWNVRSVQDMSYLFWSATAFNQDISKWHVKQVRTMGAMFEGATSFNQNIANWDVSSVDVMTGMFMGAESFDQNLSRWSVGRTRDMSNMFSFSGLSNRNYNSILLNWKHLPFFQEGNSLEILSVSITKQQ